MEALKKKMAALREEKETALSELEGVKGKLREAEQESASVRHICMYLCDICSLSCARDGGETIEQLRLCDTLMSCRRTSRACNVSLTSATFSLAFVQYQQELHMERQKMKLIEDDLESAEDRLSQAQKRAEKAETELEEKTRLAGSMHAYW